MQQVKAKHYYDASVEAVFTCFGTAEKIIAKTEELGARNIDIRKCELTDSTLEIDIQKQVPTDAPSMMKKFLSEWNDTHQTESWTGTPGEHYHGKFSIELHGVPVTISGTCDLKPYDGGAINEVAVNIECGIPLVGKKLEKFIAENIEKSMEQEYQAIKKVV